MLNIFLLKRAHTPLADPESDITERVEVILKANPAVNLNCTMEEADAMIMQEDFTFKNFHYIKALKSDPVFQKYAYKIFGINIDDSATGLVKGVYTSLTRKRFNASIHCIVPYPVFPNELMLIRTADVQPKYLGSWRGNPTSNRIRNKIIRLFGDDPDFDIQSTLSWYNHSGDEKQVYKNSVYNARFSLCPGGQAPVTHRIYESMAVSRCPVFLADEFIPPNGPDWKACSITVAEANVGSLKQILKENEPKWEELGNNAYEAWKKYFCPDSVYQYYADQLVNLIKTAKPGTNQDEYKRWDSFKMHYTNNWTLPQRILNKISQKIPAK